MTVSRFLLTTFIVFSSSAFAATTDCGKVLAQAPWNYQRLHHRLDWASIQPLLMFQFEQFKKPILLVGEPNSGKTLIINSLTSKASHLGIPYVIFYRDVLTSNVPRLTPGFPEWSFGEDDLGISLVPHLPKETIIAVDWELWDFYLSRPERTQATSLGPIDAVNVTKMLSILKRAVVRDSSLAIMGIPSRVFDRIVAMTGPSIYEQFDVISTDTGEVLAP